MMIPGCPEKPMAALYPAVYGEGGAEGYGTLGHTFFIPRQRKIERVSLILQRLQLFNLDSRALMSSLAHPAGVSSYVFFLDGFFLKENDDKTLRLTFL